MRVRWLVGLMALGALILRGGDCLAQQVSPEAPDGVLSDYLHCKNLPLAQARMVTGDHGSRTLLIYGFVADDAQKSVAEQSLRDFVGDRAVRLQDDLHIRPEIDQMDTDDAASAVTEPSADTTAAGVDSVSASAGAATSDPSAVDEIPGEQFSPPVADSAPAPARGAAQSPAVAQSSGAVQASNDQQPAEAAPIAGQPSQAYAMEAPGYAGYVPGPRALWMPASMVNNAPVFYGAMPFINTVPTFYGAVPMGLVQPQMLAATPPAAMLMQPLGTVTPELLQLRPQNAWPNRPAASISSHFFPLGTVR